MNIKILEKVKGRDGYLILVDTGLSGTYKYLTVIQDFEGCVSIIDKGRKELSKDTVENMTKGDTSIFDLIDRVYIGVPISYNIPIVKKLFDNVYKELSIKSQFYTQ